jgi:hypothetical protein
VLQIVFLNKNKKTLFYMEIGNINLIYSHDMVHVWSCLKYMWIRARNYSCGMEISQFNLDYVELCCGCSNFVNNVYSHFVKIISIFYDSLMDTKIFNNSNFYNFWTLFRYYYNYYVLILQCKIVLYIANNWIIYLSMINGLLWNLWVQIYLLCNFLNLISGTCSSIWNYFWYTCTNSFNMWKIVKHFQFFKARTTK